MHDNLSAAQRIREVAEAYAAGNKSIEEERLRELEKTPRESLESSLLSLLDLGVVSMPKSPDDWRAFESESRELVVFEARLMKIAGKKSTHQK